ncbi:hypothetical protein [Saccharopolyspora shandongensis]|uniref:hypothetical protein n=1 Tax=Saccharopolyspora shandongensis TaxID=418495 RepID=UPI000B868CF8|nr:hypothetical protein [Saccharopolyspora shandongensis]
MPNESLWKFLADHIGHPLIIRFDYEDGMAEAEEDYTEIGGEAADDNVPPSVLHRWQDDRDKPLRAISVRNANESSMVARNLSLPSPYVLRQIADTDASQIVFRHFEQLWTKIGR